MVLTNKEIMSVFTGLQLLKNDNSIKFSGRVAYLIVRNLRVLNDVVSLIDSTRTQILKKYGNPVELENGSEGYSIPKQNIDAAAQELNELDQVENELGLTKIKFSDIEDKDLTVEIIDAIYPIIDGEVE